ncbi:MAG: chemotaxis protein CheA [Lachnospiraceae bacterium]|nr:chemotaxis protein CheA [Lachnospiraceae bacterium]MDD6505530.1 chemotaxis protein CheA [Lachnospiraceae bacterium]
MAEEFNTGDMLDVYLYENQQLLEALQDMVLEQKDADAFDEDSINEIFRTMHTIKGSSGIMMFDEITKASHKLEDIFYFLRESHPENVPHQELIEHVLATADFISGELDKLADGESADGDATELVAELDKFLTKIKDGGGKKTAIKENVHEEPTQFYIAPASNCTKNYFKVYLTYTKDIEMANMHAFKTVHALKEIADDIMYSPEDILTNPDSAQEIVNNGFMMLIQMQGTEEDIRAIVQPGYDIQKVDVYQCSERDFKLGFDSVGSEIRIDLDSSVEEIEARAQKKNAEEPEKTYSPGDFVVAKKEPGKAKTLAKDKPKKAEKAAFISVDISKMDMLMDLIGELVISQSVVLQNPDLKVPGLNLDNFNKAAGQMSKISTDLQNVIMSMRMVPLTATFQKMNRIVFDMSRKLDKDVEFEMVGDTTEVDKNIIEHISDPLMHLVRNSVDHGIETKEERAAAGKKEKGKVTLSAKTESGKVWITVADNGAGLDRDKILAKARQQGLLEPGRAESSYSDKEVFQFITLPGFSTNKNVTEYSGRGVGMDVVVSNLQSVGGTLEIESQAGKGSSMILKIPLTLAIIDGIVMEVGKSSFVVETSAVKEFVSVKESMMIHEPTGEESIMIRGECYPVLRVGDWYHLHDYQKDVEKGMMVIVEVDKRKICLFVDRLVGKQEIVVKPIPDYVHKVRGLSGCTQLGDGSIALIMDPAGIME